MAHITKALFVLLSVTLLTACNNDVFVDRPDYVSDAVVDISTPQQITQVRFEQNNLESVTFNAPHDCHFALISPDGKNMSESTGLSVTTTPGACGRLEIYAVSLSMSVYFDNGRFEIFTTRNYSNEAFEANIELDYGSRKRKIHINVAPSGVLTVYFCATPDNSDIKFDFVTKKMPDLVFENNTDDRQTIVINPYEGLACNVDISFNDHADKIIDLETAPEVPVISADEYGPFMSNRYVRLTDEPQKTSIFFERSQSYSVPPHSKFRFTIDVTFSIVESPLLIICTHPDEPNSQTNLNAAMHVEDPIAYSISYEKID